MSQSFCTRCGMSLDNPREEKTGRHQEYQRCIELLKGHLDRLFTIAHKCKTALDALSELIVWDRDLPAAPALVRIRRGGRTVEAVAQITKSGHIFVFEHVGVRIAGQRVSLGGCAVPPL